MIPKTNNQGIKKAYKIDNTICYDTNIFSLIDFIISKKLFDNTIKKITYKEACQDVVIKEEDFNLNNSVDDTIKYLYSLIEKANNLNPKKYKGYIIKQKHLIKKLKFFLDLYNSKINLDDYNSIFKNDNILKNRIKGINKLNKKI